MTKDEALKMSLEALENAEYSDYGNKELNKAITAIKEALTQPEQEPLEYWNAVEGWVKIDEVREHFESVSCGTIYKHEGEGRVPLYTTPPQRTWVGLTDDELTEIRQKTFDAVATNHEVYRTIEAKLKDKNT